MRILFPRSSLFCVFILTAVLLSGPILSGQECMLVISGQVIDAHDREPLEYATIYIVETGTGASADAEGWFMIGQLCAGNYTLRISHVGCETKTRKVRLTGSLEVSLLLEHHAELLETIQVASKSFGQSVSQSRESIGAQEVARFSGKTFGEALESISGVTALQTGPTVFKPIIRGLHSNRVILFNNGLRQAGQEWGSDHAPEIDLQAFDKITVMKGAGTMEYGVDAIGGVIVADQGLLPFEGQASGSANLVGMTNGGLVGAGVEYAFPFGLNKHFAGDVQASWRKAGDFRSPAYHLTNTGLEEWNGSLHVGYEKGLNSISVYLSTFNTRLGVLRSAHIGNLTDFENAISSDRPLIIEDFSYRVNSPRQQVSHHLGKVEASKWYSWGMIKLLYGAQYNSRKEFDIRRGDRDRIPALSLALFSQQAQLSVHHHPEGDGLHGTIGLVVNHRDNTNNPETGIRPLVPDYTFIAPGVFITERLEEDNFTLEAGFRFDHQRLQVLRFNQANQLERPEFQFNQFSATLGGLFNVSDAIAISGNVSTAHRAPGVHELFSEGLHHGAAAIEEGNSELSPERSVEVQAGIDWQISGAMQLTFEPYWKRINDFIYLQPLPDPVLTIRGAFPVFRYSQTDARMFGFDAGFTWQLSSKLRSLTQASVVRASDLQAGTPLIFMPPDQIMHRFSYQTAESGSGKSWDGTISVRLVRRQDRVPEGVDLTDPPGGFILFDIGAGMKFPIGRQQGKVSLVISNAFNERYRSYLNRLRYFADEIGRNIQFRFQYSFIQQPK